MTEHELRNRKKLWLALTVYTVLFLGLLWITNLEAFNGWIGSVLRVLRPVLIGLALAYLLNSFFRFYERNLFYKIHPIGLRRAISLIFTYLTLFLIIAVLLMLIIPQLMESILAFIGNFETNLDNTVVALNNLIQRINEILPKHANGTGMIPPVHPETIRASLSDLFSSFTLNTETVMRLLTLDNLEALAQIASEFIAILGDVLFGLFISLYLLNTKEKRYRALKIKIKLPYCNHTSWSFCEGAVNS